MEFLSIKGKTLLITAGPTYEPIDPVRFIGNHSSGKMGYSIAQEAVNRGAKVILISGPVSLTPPHEVEFISVNTASEMYAACLENIHRADIAVFAAAVADYTPKFPSTSKLKKKSETLSIELVPTPDIAREMGKIKQNSQYFIGFALETDQEQQNALDKLHKKNMDLVVLNSMNDQGAGFKHLTNKITLVKRDGTFIKFDLKNKLQVAQDILDHVYT